MPSEVKGLFVRGAQIDEVMKTFPAVARFQAIVTRDDQKDSLRYSSSSRRRRARTPG